MPHTQRANKNSQSLILSQQSSHRNSQREIENLDELVNNCVRYFIYKAGNNLPIRKVDLQKNVLKNVGRNFDSIIGKVTAILKDVYSYDLYVCNDGNTKQYLISNNLMSEENGNNKEDVHKILIMLVLTHIFMSNNYSTEVSLFAFLRSLQIDSDKRHDIFGNVKDFISVTMVKQKYLNTEVEEGTRRVAYVWGARAEHEISKHKLLSFVCKMYKDRMPKSWTNQFESANTQFPQNGINRNEIAFDSESD